MKKGLFFAFLLVVFSLTAQAQRNTILIIADDLSPDYFGFYGNTLDTVDVPNIRRLLARGIRFTNLTSNPVCSSTRTTILTGRYSFRTGVGGIVGGAGGSNGIDPTEMSIPRLLRTYNPNIVKANIGKWHLNQPNPPANLLNPLTLGYDWYEGPFIGQLPSFTNWQKYTNGVASTVTRYATTENVDNALAWLRAQNQTKPFFMWLAFNAPHEPLHLPPAGLHSYTTLSGTAADINLQPKKYFKAMVQAMDSEMGRLFANLQLLNRLDSTDIIFIGDNGNTPRTAQIANLNKAKGTVYEYGVHVPLIIAGPSVVNKGRVSTALVNTADLFATIVENFGYANWRTQIAAARPVDSRSLRPILKNTATSVRPWAFSEIFKLTHDNDEGKAMRTLTYKLIRFNYGAEEFYNLALDPLENTNLLTGPLTATDLTNYQYLCREMTTLVGTNTFCTAALATTNATTAAAPFEVFPNPAGQLLTVRLGQAVPGNAALALVDALGRVVYRRQNLPPLAACSVDVSALPRGVYCALLETGAASFRKTIVVE